ncbi:hypothetical protein GCK72_001903 [Caenorhabditis remanei]|nr:hypothetical protein GCK72_001903 [Caenorhabditis remanei]KAF1770085.1 hypothetical protein GCK72_001903 [Caenorhabditis remanei]
MNPEENQKALEQYTQEISTEALKDAKHFLENSLPAGQGVQKDILLAEVLSEEQQIEKNRKTIESSIKEHDDLSTNLPEEELKTLEQLQFERDELQKKRQEENTVIAESYKSIEDIIRMKRETDEMRERYMKKKVELDEIIKKKKVI